MEFLVFFLLNLIISLRFPLTVKKKNKLMKGKTIVRIRCLIFLKMDEDHKCGYIPNQIHFNWFTFVWIVIFCYKKVNKIFPDDTFEKRKTRSILVLGISFYRVLKFVLLQFDPRFLCVLWGWGAKLLTLCNTIIHYLSYSICNLYKRQNN